tara:strand:- start:4341 stop:4580 length:240 start_codon:yes stop_codon:yes gene_type:complete
VKSRRRIKNKEIYFRPAITIMKDGEWRTVFEIQSAWFDLPKCDGNRRKMVASIGELRSYLRLNKSFEKNKEMKTWRMKI